MQPSEGAREQARILLREGNQRIESGEYLNALDCFERAYQMFPSPKLHFNIAQTLNELGRLVEAIDHYEAFVAQVRRDAEPELYRVGVERIASLAARIGRLEIRVYQSGASVTVDAAPAGVTPLAAAVRVVPGKHVVIATKAGFLQKVVQAEARAGQTEVVEVELELEGQARAALERQAERGAAEARAAARRTAARRRRSLLIAGGVLAGIGVTAVAGGGLWAANDSANRTVQTATSLGSVQGAIDQGNALRPATTATLVIGSALSVVGAVLLGTAGLAARPRDRPAMPGVAVPEAQAPPVSLAPFIDRTGAGLFAEGRF